MISWKEDYASGRNDIDEHHKVLFSYIDDLESIINSGEIDSKQVTDLLDALDSYTKFHFGYEEICMTERKCSAACQNKAAHEVFLKTIFDYRERAKKETITSDMVEDIYTTMLSWLLNHICTIDRNFRKCSGSHIKPKILESNQ